MSLAYLHIWLQLHIRNLKWFNIFPRYFLNAMVGWVSVCHSMIVEAITLHVAS